MPPRRKLSGYFLMNSPSTGAKAMPVSLFHVGHRIVSGRACFFQTVIIGRASLSDLHPSDSDCYYHGILATIPSRMQVA